MRKSTSRRTHGNPSRRLSPEVHQRLFQAIRDRYPAEGPQLLAPEFGLTVASVSMHAWRLGVRFAGNQYKKSAAARSRNSTSVNQTYFDTWSPNTAYLLGYTWADGTVHDDGRHYCVHYRCSRRDEELLLKVKRELACTSKTVYYYPVLVVEGVSRKCAPQVGFSVTCRHLVKTLIERHGIVPNKSNLDPPMTPVPDEYLCHFARGVLDGDGCISGKRVIFYGSHRMIRTLRDAISRVAFVKAAKISAKCSSVKLSRFGWGAARDIRALADWLYPPGNYLFMDRKKLKMAKAVAAVSHVRYQNDLK